MRHAALRGHHGTREAGRRLRALSRGAASAAVLFGFWISACGGADKADCLALCTWAYESCPERRTKDCAAKCEISDQDDVDNATKFCVDQGHKTCELDVCCIYQVYYDDPICSHKFEPSPDAGP